MGWGILILINRANFDMPVEMGTPKAPKPYHVVP
jgi:hypothetical protein